MVVRRGEIWWAELPDDVGSAPAFRRPVLIVQSDAFNQSGIRTVVAVSLTSNLRLADAPGNVLLPRTETGLPRDSVVNVSQISTLDKVELDTVVTRLPTQVMRQVDIGLRIALDLP